MFVAPSVDIRGGPLRGGPQGSSQIRYVDVGGDPSSCNGVGPCVCPNWSGRRRVEELRPLFYRVFVVWGHSVAHYGRAGEDVGEGEEVAKFSIADDDGVLEIVVAVEIVDEDEIVEASDGVVAGEME